MNNSKSIGSRIDWLNHTITFFSTILGIIIALALDDWNERRKEQQSIRTAIESLKGEMETNIQTIKENLSNLKSFSGFNSAIVKFRVGDIGDDLIAFMHCTKEEFDSLRAIYPNELSDESIIGKPKNSKLIVRGEWFGLIPGNLSFYNWDAVKSSGILYRFEHDQIVTFSRLYGAMDRDYAGVSSDDLVIMQVQDSKMTSTLFNEKVASFRFSNDMKLQMVDSDYKKIMEY